MLKEWGARLRGHRLRARLSQETLSKGAGISQSYLSQLENGDGGRPSYEVVKALANALPFAKQELMASAGYADPDAEGMSPRDPLDDELDLMFYGVKHLSPAGRKSVRDYIEFVRQQEEDEAKQRSEPGD